MCTFYRLLLQYFLDYNPYRIRLRDIEVLTLNEGEMTRGRRVSPIPQLNRVGGNGPNRNDILPKSVQCYNKGWNGTGIQVFCT